MSYNRNIDIFRLADAIQRLGASWGILEFLQDDVDAVIELCDAFASERDVHPGGEKVVYTFHDGTGITVWDGLDTEAH